jgi:imidazolonepropionase-like amidohydrolase
MSSDIVAIVGGTLIDGTGADPVPDTTVIVRGTHICAVGPRAGTPLPENATVLEARGRTVLPGLIDLHQHVLNEWDKALFPQRGITSVRFAGGKQALILKLRDRVQGGELVGPRIFSVGPTMDSPPTARPQSALVVNSPVEATREAERLIREEHVDALFAARRINADFLRAMLDVAHSHGKPVTGQVYDLSARQAAEVGIDGLENTSRIPESPVFDHATLHGYRSVSHRLGMLGRLWATAPVGTMQEVLGTLAEHHVEWAPGLVSFEHWAGFLQDALEAEPRYLEAPEELKQNFRQMKDEISKEWTEETRKDWRQGLERAKHWIGYYHKIGGPIVTGTDTAFGAITYHRELGHLREAGLSPMDIIVAATSRSAHALRQPYLGIVGRGKLADILVVEGNPLRSLDSLKHPVHVLIGGRLELIDGQVRRPNAR